MVRAVLLASAGSNRFFGLDWLEARPIATKTSGKGSRENESEGCPRIIVSPLIYHYYIIVLLA